MKSIAGGGGESLERIHYLYAPFTPSSSHLTDAGHPRAFIYFHAVRMPRVASAAFRRAWNRKEKRTSRERQRRMDREWISRAERLKRGREERMASHARFTAGS